MSQKPTSLERTLTERYSERLDRANMSRHAAKLALRRIAQIYSGQLHFEWPEQELYEQRAATVSDQDTVSPPPRQA